MRIAAIADLHFSPQVHDRVRDNLNRVREEADVLILAGDLTNFGRPDEMDSLMNVLVRLRIPIVAVLGNHDYESGRASELMKMLTEGGIKVLDGTAYERDGVGFAGTKGFPGGFGRGALTAFGEPEVKAFVQAAIDEALKLERALSQLRSPKRVVVLHYAPIGDTIKGEPPEIYPYLGSSRLAEVVVVTALIWLCMATPMPAVPTRKDDGRVARCTTWPWRSIWRAMAEKFIEFLKCKAVRRAPPYNLFNPSSAATL